MEIEEMESEVMERNLNTDKHLKQKQLKPSVKFAIEIKAYRKRIDKIHKNLLISF